MGLIGDTFTKKLPSFPEEGRDERIARSLAALSMPNSIQLTKEQWKEIAEEIWD